jgi:xanthine dehydrogenase accessory factor
MLEQSGVRAGEMRDGISFARNRCPSKGTIDVFIEAVMPAPECVICGASPVAAALARLAPAFGFSVTVCAPAGAQSVFEGPDRRIEGYALDVGEEGARFIVVSTQGAGDEAALRAALSTPAAYVAFVGSRAKVAALRDEMMAEGVGEEAFAALRAPAGLDIGAITPEEIALSILAEMVQVRRRGQRVSGAGRS